MSSEENSKEPGRILPMLKKIVALIPLRGGSKSIPHKNIKVIAGRPLFFWTTRAAVESNVFSDVYISTDSNEITECVRKYFNETEVTVLKRADYLATDEASTEAVMLNFASKYDFTDICLIQATSPITSVQDIKNAFLLYTQNKFDSLFTAVQFKRFLWGYDSNPITYDFRNRPRRQEFKGCLMENGSFYFTRREILLNEKNRLGGKIGYYVMAEETAVEIDEPSDWDIVARLIQKNSLLYFKRSLEHIRAIIFDVDGTMTDAGMYYGETGETLKKFNTRDAEGIACLREQGIKIGVITGENSPSVTSRMNKLQIECYEKDVSNKLPVFNKMIQKWGLLPSQVGYMGDDISDKLCMEAAGYSFCPQDAVENVKHLAGFVCAEKSGEGAVREVANVILKNISPAQLS